MKQIELFTAGCKLCERAERILREQFKGVELEVHRARECVDGECCQRAEEVGVRAVPAVAVGGCVVVTGLPGPDELAALRAALL